MPSNLTSSKLGSSLPPVCGQMHLFLQKRHAEYSSVIICRYFCTLWIRFSRAFLQRHQPTNPDTRCLKSKKICHTPCSLIIPACKYKRFSYKTCLCWQACVHHACARMHTQTHAPCVTNSRKCRAFRTGTSQLLKLRNSECKQKNLWFEVTFDYFSGAWPAEQFPSKPA